MFERVGHSKTIGDVRFAREKGITQTITHKQYRTQHMNLEGFLLLSLRKRTQIFIVGRETDRVRVLEGSVSDGVRVTSDIQ